jgi:hypothetical protein
MDNTPSTQQNLQDCVQHLHKPARQGVLIVVTRIIAVLRTMSSMEQGGMNARPVRLSR